MCGAERVPEAESGGWLCCLFIFAATCVLYCSTRTPNACGGGRRPVLLSRVYCCRVCALLLHPHTECTGGQDVDEVQLLLKEGRMVLFR